MGEERAQSAAASRVPPTVACLSAYHVHARVADRHGQPRALTTHQSSRDLEGVAADPTRDQVTGHRRAGRFGADEGSWRLAQDCLVAAEVCGHPYLHRGRHFKIDVSVGVAGSAIANLATMGRL
jgi:hypothetical protein